MKICLVTPAAATSRVGNRVTAVRWSRILRELGHRVFIDQEYDGRPCDILIALHARKSATSISRFRRIYPDGALVLALTGTDLYRDIHTSKSARRSLESATRLVVLQPMSLEELSNTLRSKTRVIYQSVPRPKSKPAALKRSFEVCVLGHLRKVKDPFRTALAARRLPSTSRIRVTHMGAALTAEMARLAKGEQAKNRRYRWLGELPRWKALRILSRSRLLVQSSRMEGGANAIGEAIRAGVPVLSSRIAGSIGILGADYPGYFDAGDTRALTALLARSENDPSYTDELVRRCRRLDDLFDPAIERDSWRMLLSEF